MVPICRILNWVWIPIGINILISPSSALSLSELFKKILHNSKNNMSSQNWRSRRFQGLFLNSQIGGFRLSEACLNYEIKMTFESINKIIFLPSSVRGLYLDRGPLVGYAKKLYSENRVLLSICPWLMIPSRRRKSSLFLQGSPVEPVPVHLFLTTNPTRTLHTFF